MAKRAVTTKKALLERCMKSSGSDDPELCMLGLLHRYRPDGDGLSELYSGVELAEGIVERLKQVMKVDGRKGGMCLKVNYPEATNETEAVTLLIRYLENLQSLSEETCEPEVGEFLAPFPRINAIAGKLNRFRDTSRTIKFNQALGDFVDEIMIKSNPSSAATLLNDAVYNLVYDFPLQYYIQWPAYEEHFTTRNPFLPYFEMWSRSIKFRFSEPDAIEVFIQ